ncbi:hypothetical protein BC938DRAFT_484074 [Jimgerdemannia flammicorona]|uniref:Uncharacterized protein n=1 Tax=Jimgerdemannia flammicorona TaxID=994334 RepID=A0A433QAL0_9FUNG|nr:hypothetical protein BC938DRAFT_484074 [Jimgerdemannia flammicorona]
MSARLSFLAFSQITGTGTLTPRQQRSGEITRHSSHTALADELRDLQRIFADDSHPAYEAIRRLRKDLKETRKWCQRTPWLIRQPSVEKVMPRVEPTGSAECAWLWKRRAEP